MCFARGYDNWAMEVQGRLESCIDLPAEEAVYHLPCHVRFCSCQSTAGHVGVGRPVKSIAQQAFERLCEHLETYCDNEEMYTLEGLRTVMTEWGYRDEDIYGTRSIKNKLKERYGEHMFFAEVRGRKNVLCFKDFASHILSDKWYGEKDADENERAVKVVRQAARLIAAQLRNMECSMTHYPDINDLSCMHASVVPPLLHLKVGELVRDQKKQSAIEQTIVQAAKPRSCIMPLMFGLGVDIHRKHGSAELVKQLSRLGFCISLDEVYRYFQSVMQTPNSWNSEESRHASFTQFIADNVDHNIRTVDGVGTFHGMGIMATSLFPERNTLKQRRKIPRLHSRLKVASVCRDARVPVVPYTGQAGAGLMHLKMKSIQTLHQPVHLTAVTRLTTLWHAGGLPCVNEGRRPMWGGFMTTVCEGEYPPPASIRLLPILDLNPSDVTCIYSTLLFLRKQADYLNIPTACVTFDQPLYIKAVDIVRNENLDIVICLGGFHTAMNFMGAIGSNMRGSGLEEVFEIIYGKKTVEHVMTGKAYMRAMRGHTLVTGALSLIVMQNLIPK